VDNILFYKKIKKEKVYIFLIILLGLIIRSLNFSYFLNFSTDQALFATKSLEIWKNKEITLVGPPISYSYFGRNLFQGSITYYFQLLFLLPAKFDPIISSYLFMIFSVFMGIPLYHGTKLLISKKSALLILILYNFLPFYIDYSRFLWNPNFQFSLTPLLILFMGFFKKENKSFLLFTVGFLAGLLSLFHYQYLIIIFGLGIYYFFIKKNSLRNLFMFLVGIIGGFLPMIVFELKNNFYNLQTLFFYLNNINQKNSSHISISPHYLLSISLFFFLILVSRLNIKNFKTIFLFVFLIIFDCFLYFKKPNHAFGMIKNWNYLGEKKTYEIIKKTVKEKNLSNFNIVNQGYDTTATVQKYLLKKDGIKINYDDYYHNQYLFIVTNKNNFMEDPAYEVNTFKPSKILKTWEINSNFKLYLLKRI
jgi:hypothetical protein